MLHEAVGRPLSEASVEPENPSRPLRAGVGVPGGKFLRSCETLVEELDEGG